MATYVAFGMDVIGWSVSDLSQILVNSKRKTSLISSLWSEGLRQISLILDKYIIGLRLVRLVIIVSSSTARCEFRLFPCLPWSKRNLSDSATLHLKIFDGS